MKRIPFVKLGLATCAAAVTLATAASGASDRRRGATPSVAAAPAAAPTSAAGGFDAFQLVAERNIFNPNRVGRTRAGPEEKPARVDEISLVGTMQYDRGIVAFFDSPDAAYRKTLREGETIGDFTVQRISAAGVELVRNGQPVALRVAQQLRRPEGGEWTVIDIVPAPDPRAGAEGLRPADAPPAEVPADASEALKRLLKKREKQFKQ